MFRRLSTDLRHRSHAISRRFTGGSANIGDYFAGLAGKTNPKYLEMLTNIKTEIAPSRAQIDKTYASVMKEIETKLPQVSSMTVPQINFSDILRKGFTDSQEKEFRSAGSVILKGVVDRDVAIGWKERVKQYIEENPNQIGFPQEDIQVYEIYWSQSQIEARQNERVVAALAHVNSIWSGARDPIMYVDRLRIRQPGDESFKLGPHIDSGAIERFQDPTYRKVYESILYDDWKEYNPYDAKFRVDAIMDMYTSGNGCSMFRTFQGWLSLSDVESGTGSLQVNPMIKEATAYWMIRPFLGDVIDTPEFCGAYPGVAHEFSQREFHAPLLDGVVSIPSVEPGDFVFWHCDAIHAVDSVHTGKEDSSVFYIPAAFDCPLNRSYLDKQREAFDQGKSPPDFPQTDSELEFVGRATPSELNALGRRVMGYEV